MMATVIATEMILKAADVVKTRIPAKAASMIVRSLVNLVEILPEGFESKNKIGDLITLKAIVLCMLVVDVKTRAYIM